ncbi:MAG: hypothetical protein NTY02_18695 [Acidobacteria bacterium]|nr:hypothetical protein [Acidobacteriota bacterium]
MRRTAITLLLTNLCLLAPAFIVNAQSPPSPPEPTATGPLQELSRHEDGNATVLRWDWLIGTTWYVPAANPLGFLLLDAQTVVPVLDQTVYHITDYRQGFFWGKLVKKTTGSPPSCLSMIGSVTPEGWIQMSLVSQAKGTDAAPSRGTGIMTFRGGEWTMVWQGASGPDAATQYSHWAYMTQTRPGLPSWEDLPFVNVSVPDFMAQCPGSGPKLVETGRR